MILSLLTGGIDLPKLAADVADLRRAIVHAAQKGRPHLGPTATVADVIYWMRCRIDALENLVASRAFAQDVETLRLKLDRVDDDNATTSAELHDAIQKLATIKANHEDIAALRATVAGLSATVAGLPVKIDALTAAKLSEVKARKAPAKK